MTASIRRRYVAYIVAIFHLLTMSLFTFQGAAMAQSVDDDPPVIEMEVVLEGVRGETQVFSATITDNIAVTDVTFHYRFDGDSEYASVEMALVPNTTVYTASVSLIDDDVNAIEYYVEARDGGDNRTLQGFSFDPLERSLVSADSIAVASNAGGVSSLSTNQKIIYGVLGLLVVGALAASAGGSSGGSTGGPGPQVPTQIFVEPFQ